MTYRTIIADPPVPVHSVDRNDYKRPKYAAVVADPPVPFAAWGRDTGQKRAAEAHYSTMTWTDLEALGPAIQEATTPDAVLFLWVCQPLLIETIRMAEAWGFTYKTKAFAWVKLTTGYCKFFTGMGYWTRANTEDVLLFTRGKPKRLRADVKQLVATLEDDPYNVPTLCTQRGKHSEKPEQVQDAIEKLVEGPYLELFARRQRPNWTCLGNEIDGRDIREALTVRV
jgi:N6-adenosine-specific RNA methylase IME4